MTDTTEKLAAALADWGSPWQGTGTAEEFCRLLAEQGLALVPVEPPNEWRGEFRGIYKALIKAAQAKSDKSTISAQIDRVLNHD